MYAFVRPFLDIKRRISPSKNPACITALGALLRTINLSALEPKATPKASNIIDFPDPVSPVITVKPD